MPMFDFLCTECGYQFEKIVPSATADLECAHCGAVAERQVSIPAKAKFNGSGFYETDFKNK